jgi:hypothetical protein
MNRRQDIERGRARSMAEQPEQQAAEKLTLVRTEIRETARGLFLDLVSGHLREVAMGGPQGLLDEQPRVDLRIIKLAASLAANSAPYLHQALGMIQIDDAKQWGSLRPAAAPTEKEEGNNGEA